MVKAPATKTHGSEILRFVFSYYGLATTFFAIAWIVEIRRGVAWMEYVCLALVNCLGYFNSRFNAYEPPLKLFLWAQLVVAIIVALVVWTGIFS